VHSCIVLCLCEGSSFFFLASRMVPACSFYSLKEVQGYKMFVRGRSLLEKQPQGLGGALSDGDVVCTVESWRRYF
jgi:hypothetical protein